MWEVIKSPIECHPRRESDGRYWRHGRITGSGEIHSKRLSGVSFLEAVLEITEGRLSVSNCRFFRKVEVSLGVVMILGTRTNDICI